MKKHTSRFVYILLSVILILGNISTIYAASEPIIEAVSAIVMDQESGKVLYDKDADKKMFPASTTKILTAIVALEYLFADEFVVAGNEVNSVPYDSSKAGHKSGETLRVDNLIRGLIIPSGNETACVVAIEVARRVSKESNISYQNAEKLFCGLMNEKAKELGATSTNFVNPHGYHNDNHYTTAHDMALITREAMKNPLIKQIAQEKEFIGNGAGENPDPSTITQEYNWETHNELLRTGDYYYSYATGIKTGFTNEASSSLSATATKDDKDFIAVIFFSPDPARWTDAVKLFDYSFETFNIEIVQEKEQALGEVEIDNPLLGEPDEITVISKNSFSSLMSKDELSRITSDIAYDRNLIADTTDSNDNENSDSQTIKLITPIATNQVVGTITYSLDGEEIFVDDILSSSEALERTFGTDFDYYLNKTKATVFSLKAIPFWVGGILLIIIIIFIITKARRRSQKRSRSLGRRY